MSTKVAVEEEERAWRIMQEILWWFWESWIIFLSIFFRIQSHDQIKPRVKTGILVRHMILRVLSGILTLLQSSSHKCAVSSLLCTCGIPKTVCGNTICRCCKLYHKLTRWKWFMFLKTCNKIPLSFLYESPVLFSYLYHHLGGSVSNYVY